MTKHIKTLLVLTAVVATSIGIVGFTHSVVPVKTVEAQVMPVISKPALTHQQLVYTYALEWCESGGNLTVVNPKDKDGTPSYYSWQWKPSTFKYFAVLYAVLPKTVTDAQALIAMHDYDSQRKVIEAMVLHGKDIQWKQQFPGCTRKLGIPPLSTVITNTNG